MPVRLIAAGRRGARLRAACAWLMLAPSALGSVACVRKEVSTFRWGGLSTVGRYLVDMGSLRRTGPRVDFVALFLPEANAKTPALGKLYIRSEEWIDCAQALSAGVSTQPYVTDGGYAIGLKTAPTEAGPAPIRPGSTWSSVRDLVCAGRNEIDAPPLTGTDAAVAAQGRARMAAHPVVQPADAR